MQLRCSFVDITNARSRVARLKLYNILLTKKEEQTMVIQKERAIFKCLYAVEERGTKPNMIRIY